MGMHIGLIAAKASLAQLREAVLRTWNEYEVTASQDLSDDDALWAWKKAHEVFVSADKWSPTNRGTTVFAFRQDGGWAIMMDWSYELASDEERLPMLSSQLGTVLSLVVETAGGSAHFSCHENGGLRRVINNADGELSFEGAPLAEEAGLNIDRFYVEESEALLKAFGLSSIKSMATQSLQAICVVDHTDYDQDLPAHAAASGSVPRAVERAMTQPPKRPWWKFS